MTNPTYLNPVFFFLNGAAFFGAWACGICFLRHWAQGRDRLLLIFGLAFHLLGVERLCLALASPARPEATAIFYLIRLSAFLLILGGIWDKNRARARQPVYEN